MKVLSWDVGIINLAYCLFDVKDDKWEIKDWGIINLTNRDSLKCVSCGNNASCFTDINGKSQEEQYYCKKHIPKDLTPPTFEESFKELDKKTCINCQWGGENSLINQKTKECVKKCKFVNINNDNQLINLCTAHSKSFYKRIIDSYKVKPLKRKAVGSIDIDILKIELIKKLENRSDFLTVDSIVIENQPSMKNPKMKAIASTLYDYFLIRGIFDKKHNNSNIERVKFMSPSNKLKVADDNDTKKLVKIKGNEAKTYKLTKSLSVKYCRELIETTSSKEWLDVFNNHKKKDDLADCFLQGLYFIESSTRIQGFVTF